MLAAQAESLALIQIALIADAVARGAARTQLDVGPLSFGLEVPVAAALTGAATVVAALVVFAYGRQTARVYARMERASRDEIVDSFAKTDWEQQATLKSSRVQGQVLRLMDARARVFYGLVGWIRAFATIVVFVGVAAVMSAVMAVVIVIFGAILSLVVLPIRRQITRLSAHVASEEVGLATDVAEAADQGADVQVFGAWPAFLGRFAARSRSLELLRARVGTVRALMPVVYQYGALALILLVLLVAFMSSQVTQVGQFAASALLLLRTVQYGQQLQRSLQEIAEAVPRVSLLERELDQPAPRAVPGTRTLTIMGSLELRHIAYQYPDSDIPALHGISLTLRPGRIIGVAGPSGSGKSTLAQILLRLRWPTGGEYLVNGVPAVEYSTDSWNTLVAHVPQQTRLFHGTLAENVSFLDDTILSEEMLSALTAVGLDELVHSMPDGLHTVVGASGRNLSGGQVQRLGIARALVRRPKLVVLDEPTSALDVDAERLVADALSALRGQPDIIVLVIAHRPTTLALCDEMVVLDSGRLVAAGASDEVTLGSDFLARTWGS